MYALMQINLHKILKVKNASKEIIFFFIKIL